MPIMRTISFVGSVVIVLATSANAFAYNRCPQGTQYAGEVDAKEVWLKWSDSGSWGMCRRSDAEYNVRDSANYYNVDAAYKCGDITTAQMNRISSLDKFAPIVMNDRNNNEVQFRVSVKGDTEEDGPSCVDMGNRLECRLSWMTALRYTSNLTPKVILKTVIEKQVQFCNKISF